MLRIVRKYHTIIIHLSLFFLFSLLPVLWLGTDKVVLGHDAGFPLSPWIHFLDRLNVWTHRFGLGNDQTTEIGGFFIHGFEGIVDYMGFPLTYVQEITFGFYFFMFGVSAYILAREAYPGRHKHMPLLTGLFYMVNHFILQAWFIAERTKFTLYIALPLYLALILRVHTKKNSPLTAGLIAALIAFVLNGGAFLPLYGAVLISVPFVMILLVLFSKQKVQLIGRFLLFCLVWGLATLALSMYWILPYFRYVTSSFGEELAKSGGIDGVLAWTQYISQSASYYNMFRLQGILEWYVNPLHPYAPVYLFNPIFYISSYLLMGLAYIAYQFASKSEKKITLIFFGLSLWSMFFMAGSHTPFGFIYEWMLINIPGFVAFRTPYYKYAPALWLCYALLISLSLTEIIRIISHKWNKKWITPVGVLFIILLWSAYHFPFFTGNFFDYERNVKTTRVKVPDYVYDYADWANSDQFPLHRLLLLPGQNTDTHFEAYTWGYWSLAQLQGLLTNRSYVGNNEYKTSAEEVFIKNIYSLIERKDPTWVDHAKYLFIDGVLLRKDFDYTLKKSTTTNPADIQKLLDSDNRFTKIKEFGPWIIYSLNIKPESFTLKDYYYESHVQSKERYFEPTTLPGVEMDNKTVFIEEPIRTLNKRNKGTIYIPDCNHCLLDERKLYKIKRTQLITGGSVFYPVKLVLDRSKIEQAGSVNDKLTMASKLALTRLFELETQFDNDNLLADRTIGWRAYQQSLDTQHRYLKHFMSGIKTYTIEQNRYLSEVYENLMQNIQDMQETILSEVNHDDEAVLYGETMDKLSLIRSDIESILLYSSENREKHYYVRVDEPENTGAYNVLVKKNTTNTFENGEPTVPSLYIRNNRTTYQISTHNTENGDEIWSDYGTIDLVNGENRITIQEPEIRTKLGDDGTLQIPFESGQQCSNVPLMGVTKDYYKININAYSDRDIYDMFVFVDKKSAKTPLLPYWGNKLLVIGQKNNYLNFNQYITETGDYTIKFCRLSSNLRERRKLTVRDFYIERITSPVVALFKKNTAHESVVDSDLSIGVNKLDTTSYDLTVKGVGSSLLMFDQRYNEGWKFTPDTMFTNHRMVHGYANGWGINKTKSEDTVVHLRYDGAKLLRMGWILTAVSLISVCVIGILRYSYLKKKRTRA